MTQITPGKKASRDERDVQIAHLFSSHEFGFYARTHARTQSEKKCLHITLVDKNATFFSFKVNKELFLVDFHAPKVSSF